MTTEKQDDATTIAAAIKANLVVQVWREGSGGPREFGVDELTDFLRERFPALCRPLLPTADLAGTKAAHPPAATGQGADVWHYMMCPGLTQCGVDHANVQKTDAINHVTCLYCLRQLAFLAVKVASPSDAKQHDMVRLPSDEETKAWFDDRNFPRTMYRIQAEVAVLDFLKWLRTRPTTSQTKGESL